jgi:hypothetical protein
MNVIRKQAADDFEVKLANVADAEISQRLPSLNDYKVGFQLIEKDDEGTRGVGVMVYQVGDQWLYVPAFFLNGRIRGYDMMYLPERSQFVPAKDAWVTYLKSNRTSLLGEGKDDMEKRNPKRADSVSLRQDTKSNSIMYKSASDNSLLSDKDVESMLKVYNDYDVDAFNLRTWIPRLGKHAAISFLRTLNSSPDFANAILEHYEPEDIRKIAEAVKDKTPAQDGTEVQDGTYNLTVESTGNVNDLQIISEDDTAAVQELDDTAKEVVLRDGLYVVDNRKNTSTVFVDKQDSGSLTTPPKSGYYEVLLADGSFRKCYIIVKPEVKVCHKGIAKGTVDVKPFTCQVIDLDRPNMAYTCTRPILARRMESREETDIGGIGIKPTSLLRKFTTVDKAKDDGVAVDLSEDPSKLRPYDWEHCIAIDTKGNYQEFSLGRSKSIIGNKIANIRLPNDASDWGETEAILHLTGKPGHVCRKGKNLYIPEGARIVAHKRWCDENMPVGDLETIKHKIIKTAAWRALTIQTDGLHYSLDSKFGRERMLTKNAALIKLIKEHGIKAPDARMMLHKEASVSGPVKDEYLVKYAAPDYDEEEAKINFTEHQPYEETETMDPEMAKEDVDKVVDASDKGVKEVMDVSVLKALAANGSPNRMVEDYMQDLLLAMDRIGRILFMFYWHYNQFKDQYGQEKMSELEDSLRDNFQNLSDLTLFLHKSTNGTGSELFQDELTENFA